MQPPEWVDNPTSGWQFKLIINASANIVVIIHAPVAPPVGWLLTDCLAGCCYCSAAVYGSIIGWGTRVLQVSSSISGACTI